MDHPSENYLRRISIVASHFLHPPHTITNVEPSPCLNFSPPEQSEQPPAFDTKELRRLIDGHSVEARDWIFNLMENSPLFCPRRRGSKVFVAPDYNQSKEQQREMTMKRIEFFLRSGVFEGWLTRPGPETDATIFAIVECLYMFDHSLGVKIAVHFFLWGWAIQLFGTKRHHDKWLSDTENYLVKGCFAMTELGHGSNVRGIETITTYDASTGEFVITTPCESAQKYWIGGAANHATHTIVFSQLQINGVNQGVHAFIAQIRDNDGNICPNIRIADCGHKIGLNGVDNGRIWFDNLRVPRENLLNSVADVSPDGQYLSSIKNPDKRFAAFLAPLTSGRVSIATLSIYISKVGISIAVRYALTRHAFSMSPNGPEVLLLDYPTHQRRLLPLLARTCAMSSAANFLKRIYFNRTPETNKIIHIYSSGLKAAMTWHNMRLLQECREACGGQGLKTENRIGIFKGEFDVQSTFEGDNNVLLQQVSKALLGEYLTAQKKKKPLKGLGLEHMNDPSPVIPAILTTSVLRSANFQIDLFHFRERDLLIRYAKEIDAHQVLGVKKEHAVVLSYQLAEDLARAFIERLILQTFMDDEMSQSSGPLKDIVGILRSMYAVICIEEDASFLRYAYLSPDNAASVRKEVVKLCCDLRPHALSVVRSLGVPDSFLSPIGFDWVEANSWAFLSDE